METSERRRASALGLEAPAIRCCLGPERSSKNVISTRSPKGVSEPTDGIRDRGVFAPDPPLERCDCERVLILVDLGQMD